MSNLKKEDIQFIDTYLRKEDIIFTDIRIEMVDHIASEIENLMGQGDTRGFYFTFKDYMVENKKKLLKDRKEYYKASDKKIFRMLLKKLFSFQGIIIFFLAFFTFNLTNELIENKTMFQIVKHAPFVLLIIIAIVYYLFIRKRKERYSSIERIAFYFILMGQLTNIMMNTNIEIAAIAHLTRLKIGASLFILVIITLLMIAFEIKRDYVLKYKKSL
jgi:hypothetical protein